MLDDIRAGLAGLRAELTTGAQGYNGFQPICKSTLTENMSLDQSSYRNTTLLDGKSVAAEEDGNHMSQDVQSKETNGDGQNTQVACTRTLKRRSAIYVICRFLLFKLPHSTVFDISIHF